MKKDFYFKRLCFFVDYVIVNENATIYFRYGFLSSFTEYIQCIRKKFMTEEVLIFGGAAMDLQRQLQ